MSDTTMTGGTVDRPINDTAPQSTEPTGLPVEGDGAPLQVEGDNGSPQGASEGGQTIAEDRPRRSKVLVDRDEVLGLRSERRELRSQVSELRAMLEELKTGSRGQQPPKETPRNGSAKTFWEDPDGSLASLREEIQGLREKVREDLHSTRQQDVQQSELVSQRADAVKLIHSQPNWSESDDQELIDIIEENGLGALPPMQGAKAAMAIFNQEKGIRDTSVARKRATSMVGGPPAAPGAGKIWPKAEVDRILDSWDTRKAKYDPTLAEEFRAAHAEGRIR